jgi:pSer/pThr/pTyr-binding forkhead associated (FHA) protein
VIQFSVFVSGKHERTVVVKTLPVIFGRSPECTLTIDNPLVSRHHALVDLVDGEFVLKDLGSGNGTYMKEQLVTEDALEDGDEFLIGKHLIRFNIVDPSLKGGAPAASDESRDAVERTMAIESSELRRIVEKTGAHRIVHLEVESTGRRLRLVRPFVLVGRAEYCDLILSGWRVAPVHMLVAEEGKHHIVVDLTGRGRVLLGGQPVGRSTLSDGDVLQVGRHRIRFSEEFTSSS